MKNTIKISTLLLVLLTASNVAPFYVSALDDNDFEPNDSFATAVEITEGTHAGLTLTDSSDENDYFKIEVPEGMVISVEMYVTDSTVENYFYLKLLNSYETNLHSDGFYYYDSPDEYDDVVGDLSYYAEDATEMMYILCEWYPWNTGNATYTLIIDVYDPKGEQIFDFGINTGDELVYTSSNNIDIEATSQFYNEIGALFVDEIEDNEGTDVFSTSFNFSNFVNDLTDFLSLSFDSQFSISDIYNFDENSLDEMSVDIIEGSVRMGNDGDYVLPSEYAATKLGEFQTTIEPYFDSTWYSNNVESDLDNAIDELNEVNATDFDDVPLVTHAYYDNVTDSLGFSVDPLDNGMTFPALPSEHFIPGQLGSIFGMISNVKLCYPTDFSFEDWYNWGLEVYDFAKAYAEQENEDIEFLGFSISQLMEIGGISSFYVDKQAISFVWNLNGIDFDAVDDLINYTDGDLENDFDEELAELGIDYDNSGASFSIALEYDSDMILGSFAVYGDILITFDNEEFPDVAIDGETVSLSISQTLVREGYKPPTAEQINEGKVGEERNLKGGFSLSSIPGASVGLISLASLLSLVVLITYIKRRK
ncbi:MAG: hypothetical protein ACTSX0_05700 [Promethearchaeota archaeon]